MRKLLFSCGIIFPSAAIADPGHFGELAGHDHWVAGIALAGAAGAAIWGLIKGGSKPAKENSESVEAPESEAQEA